ncbi:hypothetical protein [Nocardia sp. alder85J]|uniref:hypothetical protein n=1 Tax=Nocardia sp. alder85J TaxID=2862949 RepID=UPI001CD1A133|nr:hypothetical protein [Nocardia sp. alder85J]MCX4097747.1 hypothetical protein [Nocardia sp. alder85J]
MKVRLVTVALVIWALLLCAFQISEIVRAVRDLRDALNGSVSRAPRPEVADAG